MTVEELSDAWLAAWSDPVEDAFAPLCAPTVHYQDPQTQAPLRGAVALGDHAALLRSGLPDVRLEAAGARPCVERFLAVPWRLRGTHTQFLAELPPSGRSIALHGLFYCELDGPGAGAAGNRMLRVRAFFDLYDAGVQLGLLPRRGTLSERALLVLRGFGVGRLRAR